MDYTHDDPWASSPAHPAQAPTFPSIASPVAEESRRLWSSEGSVDHDQEQPPSPARTIESNNPFEQTEHTEEEQGQGQEQEHINDEHLHQEYDPALPETRPRSLKRVPTALQVPKLSSFPTKTTTSSAPVTSSQKQQQQRSNEFLNATVTGLDRAVKAKPVIKFDVHTNMYPLFRGPTFQHIARTHDEFLKLYKHLVAAKPQALVPTVPPPATSAGTGTPEDTQRMKGAFQRWLNLVFSHEVLRADPEVVSFVESNFGYSPISSIKSPAEGLVRQLYKQQAGPRDDSDLQFTRSIVKNFYLQSLHTSQELEKVVKVRRSLGPAETTFGTCLVKMGENEEHHGLSSAYKSLGRVITVVGDYHARQATAEFTSLGDPLSYHSGDACNFKETLTNRNFLLRDLEIAEKALKNAEDKAILVSKSADVRRSSADHVVSILANCRAQEAELAKQEGKITAGLESDGKVWQSRTTIEIRSALWEYANRHIEAERNTLALLESVRGTIRTIDATGGLSRLGREGQPTRMRNAAASSQGPHGDAWSGLPRLADEISRQPPGNTVFGSPLEFLTRVGPIHGNSGADDVSGARSGTDPSGQSRRNTANSTRGMGTNVVDADQLDARKAASFLGTVLM